MMPGQLTCAQVWLSPSCLLCRGKWEGSHVTYVEEVCWQTLRLHCIYSGLPLRFILKLDSAGGLLEYHLFVWSCFVLAHEENELAHQSGTGRRGSGSWEGSFTSAQHRDRGESRNASSPFPLQFLARLQKRSQGSLGLETRSPTCSGVELQPASGIETTGCRGVGKPRELREHLFPGTSYP